MTHVPLTRVLTASTFHDTSSGELRRAFEILELTRPVDPALSARLPFLDAPRARQVFHGQPPGVHFPVPSHHVQWDLSDRHTLHLNCTSALYDEHEDVALTMHALALHHRGTACFAASVAPGTTCVQLYRAEHGALRIDESSDVFLEAHRAAFGLPYLRPAETMSSAHFGPGAYHYGYTPALARALARHPAQQKGA